MLKKHYLAVIVIFVLLFLCLNYRKVSYRKLINTFNNIHSLPLRCSVSAMCANLDLPNTV